jgi:GMP synthase (glutamine-hydrolysing)
MDTIIILDFGGQYCHLIARRIRELGIYAEVKPATTTPEELKEAKGIILSGGAASVFDPTSPTCDPTIFSLGIPILGICYGHQLIAHTLGGKVSPGEKGEYGITKATAVASALFSENKKEQVWMNHRDIVSILPEGFTITAKTAHSKIAAYENTEKKIFGVQFHPEVTHTTNGKEMLARFANICQARQEWHSQDKAELIVEEAKATIGGRRAIIGLSGGIDSSTAAVLLTKAIGGNLIAVFVDTGLMREGEADFMREHFSHLNLTIVNAQDRFFTALAGKTEPEEKRKTIGKLFIDIFEEEAKKHKAEVLIQGTIYSDRIESGITAHSSNIKSHHNVGGLPKKLNLDLYEPLRDLYKDEVRNLARQIGVPPLLINRHVFPGPGLAIRILGEVTPERARIVRKASHIVEEELRTAGLYEKVWMGFAVLLPIKSVGIQGDERTYKNAVAIRIIESQDAMTANFARIPYALLDTMATRITNEVPEVNRVVYDISNKPPATMEWE